MLLLPRDKTIKYTYAGGTVTVNLTYIMSYDAYQKSEGDFYLHIKDSPRDCDMVCPTCGAAL